MINKTASVMAMNMFQTLNKKLVTEQYGIAVTLRLAFGDAWLKSHVLYQLS
jgi:hypothetical protein